MARLQLLPVPKFRSPIWPGDQGTDVLATKRAYVRMGAQGAGSLITSGPARRTAGHEWVQCTRLVQAHHGLQADGKYGPATHAVVAPHMDQWSRALYSRAAKRTHGMPAPTSYWLDTAQQAAQALLALHGKGRYRADNGGDLYDLQRSAAGKPVWSHGGYWVYIDARVFRLLLYLLVEAGFNQVGTFAFCSDHMNDGPHGHAGGLAVDISSLDGVGINGSGAYDLTVRADKAIHGAPHGLVPRQLISGGSGYVYYPACEALCIPSATYYGWQTLGEHRNHIHSGY